jgi:uncharacterized protein (TIGR00369 family)
VSPSEPEPIEIAARVRDSFARQTIMATLGAEVSAVRPGEVEIVLPFSDRILQQHGFIHAGAVATIADSACGYAALTVMPGDAAVLTTEFKINLLSPAKGDRLRAVGRVIRSGKTLVHARRGVCRDRRRVQADCHDHRDHDGGIQRDWPAGLISRTLLAPAAFSDYIRCAGL